MEIKFNRDGLQIATPTPRPGRGRQRRRSYWRFNWEIRGKLRLGTGGGWLAGLTVRSSPAFFLDGWLSGERRDGMAPVAGEGGRRCGSRARGADGRFRFPRFCSATPWIFSQLSGCCDILLGFWFRLPPSAACTRHGCFDFCGYFAYS